MHSPRPEIFAGLRQRAITRRRRSEEHTSELQSRRDLVCRLLLEKKMYSSSHIYIGGNYARDVRTCIASFKFGSDQLTAIPPIMLRLMFCGDCAPMLIVTWTDAER